MALSAWAALWFLPFVLPVCFYVCFTDMREMRIPNHAVVALFAIYVVVGLVALPLDLYAWRYLNLVIVLLFGIVFNAAGVLGAGDAKFAAAAAPFVAAADLGLLLPLFAAVLLAAVTAHRLARHTGLRRLAPDWHSWSTGKNFPMGLALGGTLAAYLGLAVRFGA